MFEKFFKGLILLISALQKQWLPHICCLVVPCMTRGRGTKLYSAPLACSLKGADFHIRISLMP